MSYLQDDTERRGPTPGLVAAVIVVALILVAGLVVGIAKLTGDPADPKPGPDSTTSASSSRCGLPDGDQALPTSAPRARWELTGSFATPRSASLGPARRDGGVPVCFAHSPSGAVVAAISYLGATTDPDLKSEDLIERRVLLDDAGKRLLKSSDDEAARTPYQLAGFRVTDATRGRASVDLAVRSTEGTTAGQLYALTFTLVWSGGDWKIAVPAGGQPPTSALSTLSGFVEWSGA